MFDLKDDEKTIKKIIEEDIIGRNYDIINFIEKMDMLDLDFQSSIALNGEWGTGKTFFVKECIRIMEILNDKNSRDKIKIGNEFKNIREIKHKNTELFYPIYFNAWEYDSHENPLVVLMHELFKKGNKTVKIADQGNLFDKIMNVCSHMELSINVPLLFFEIGGKIPTDYKNKHDLFSDVLEIENIKYIFIEAMNEIGKMCKKSLKSGSNSNSKYKIIIFIDELDRCIPIFAVRLLEVIKHFFDNSKYTEDIKLLFVFSTNISELQHSVKKIYGNDFNGAYYLQKFFELQHDIQLTNPKNYIKYINTYRDPKNSNIIIGPNLNSEVIEKNIIFKITEMLNFNLRDYNRYLDVIKKSKKIKMCIEETDCKITPIISQVILPFLLALKTKKINEYNLIYNDIINGVQDDSNKKIFTSYIKYMLNSNDINFEGRERIVPSDINNFLNYLYDMLINGSSNYDPPHQNLKIENAVSERKGLLELLNS